METLWVKRQKSFNFCPVRDPPNWLGELSWRPSSSSSVFLGLPFQRMGELEMERGAYFEEMFERFIQRILGVAAIRV